MNTKELIDVTQVKIKASHRNEEERKFIKAVVQGLMDIKSGKETELNEVRKRLGIR
jgi:hypothetical protein